MRPHLPPLMRRAYQRVFPDGVRSVLPSLVAPGSRRLAIDAPHARAGALYRALRGRLDSPAPSHLFLVPWLVTGGSDRTAINYVRALHEHRLAGRIAVLATEPAESPWAKRLPGGVDFIELGKATSRFPKRERAWLLARLLLDLAPAVIHNLNSRLGYEVFIAHGEALAQASRLYCHVFCGDMTPAGKLVGYSYDQLPRCFRSLTGVFGDNATELRKLHDRFGFDASRLVAHYQPVELSPRRSATHTEGRLHVLWAGRLDRQKRVDLLVRIAERCRDRPYHFHLYGSAVLEAGRSASLSTPNVAYHGPFDGLASLPLERFDVFLYTSQWDGLPNILLEAMAASLPVIASNVGGVGELVRPGETGFLIDPFDDVDGFVAALRAIQSDRAGTERLITGANRLLADRHSWAQFVAAIRAAPGYVI